MQWRMSSASLFLAVLFCLPGCQKATQAVHPVRGQVLYKGQPIKDCRVIFYPKDNPNDMDRPEDYTDEQGFFEVTARRNEKGAAAGTYTVVLIWRDRNPDPNAETSWTGPNKLPEKFGKPSTSDLQVEVKEGKNDLPPFRID